MTYWIYVTLPSHFSYSVQAMMLGPGNMITQSWGISSMPRQVRNSGQVENTEVRKPKYGNEITEVRRKSSYQCPVPSPDSQWFVEAL